MLSYIWVLDKLAANLFPQFFGFKVGRNRGYFDSSNQSAGIFKAVVKASCTMRWKVF
jgi:hypothetical protein